MKIKTLSIGLMIFAMACQSENKADSNISKATATADSVMTNILPLPDMIFDVEKFGENEMKSSQTLSGSDLEKYQLKKMDESFPDRDSDFSDNSDVNYYLLKEMYKGKEGEILLISRTSEMENNAWLATYDLQFHLVDFKRVYYDEWAESLMQITSVIKNNKITISKHELTLEDEKTITTTNIFQIRSDLKFTIIQP